MKNTLSVYERERARLQQYEELLAKDVELFRREATKAYSAFEPYERKFLRKLETGEVTSYVALTTWEDALLPVLYTLQTKRAEPAFRRAMVKHLALDMDETQKTIHSVINTREKAVIQKFITQVYGKETKRKSHRKQRRHILGLFAVPQQEVFDMKEHLVAYTLLRHVADEHGIAVVDAHAPLRMRLKAARRVRRERKKAKRAEAVQLAHIAARTAEIRAARNGLVADILDKNIDLVTVISLRNRYEKRLSALSKSDVIHAAKRLAIFDEETREFREQYTSLAAVDIEASLESTRQMTKAIDDLLLRIFDLTTTQKNQLLLYTKEYRELVDEQAAIMQTQKNREESNR
jgi:hypothetical protein